MVINETRTHGHNNNNSIDMEAQKQQWDIYEQRQQEEEEDVVALLGRHSKPTRQLRPPPVNVESNAGRTGNVEEENKDIVTAAAVVDFNQGGVSGIKCYPGLESSSVLETNSKDEELYMEKENNFEIHKILSTEINHHHLSEIRRISDHLDQKTEVDEDLDQESTDIIDVEGVLKKQNTHDLYCPNCNSCITRRVILLRKKPKIPKIRHKQKPDHQFESPPPAADAPANQGRSNSVGSNDGITHEPNDRNPDTQPYIFRCLSCFTIFIPTGNGQVKYKPPSCTNWIFAIFGSYTRKPDTDPDAGGAREPEQSEADGINQHPSTRNMSPETGDIGPSDIRDHVAVDIGKQPVGHSAHAGSRVDESRDPEASEAQKWDILKSIVYGGLGESITSLGIVTSAAASGASTLNIFAMGLANLIGGLFLLAHNLRELKNDDVGGTSTGMDTQEDRYKKLLGRREDFWVHATLVILSFLIFGLMPPVIYGFSFRGSDDRDMKIMAVAVSSLACIMLLAIGKAHTEKPPARSYVTTVFYYISIGFMTSGLSYVVGDLINKLVEELHLFESNLEVTIPFLEPNLMRPGWASY